MKSLFVVADSEVDNHLGEEYDEVLYVEDQPTTETIQEWATRIRDRIRKLWHEQSDDEDRRVEVWLDAIAAYDAMLVNLQVLSAEEEDIEVTLPYRDQRGSEPLHPEMVAALEGRPWNEEEYYAEEH